MDNLIKAIIFDFDGVILESSEIKTDAFLEIFKEYPEHRDAILNHHLVNQGVSRYKKFEWIYKNLLDKPYGDIMGEELGNRFSKIVFEKIMKAPTVPGAIDLLEYIRCNTPAYIASGTPDIELNEIVRKRGLLKYFKNVYGSDLTKEQIISKIMKQDNYYSFELLFVGDAISDFNAAKDMNLHFVARNTPAMETFWQKNEINPVNNLMEINDRYEIL